MLLASAVLPAGQASVCPCALCEFAVVWCMLCLSSRIVLPNAPVLGLSTGSGVMQEENFSEAMTNASKVWSQHGIRELLPAASFLLSAALQCFVHHCDHARKAFWSTC